MPLKAYIGLPRQGKTYEVVTVVIYNALCQGRRVVSNIAGLNREAMLDRFIKDGGSPESFGELVSVPHEKVLDPLFWRTDKDREQGVDSFIQPGDLLALDEIWRFWSGFALKDDDGNKRPARVMNFFRMHGHFTHPVSGLCCEVALITQDLLDIHRSVRGIVDQTYVMTKLTAIGSTKRYRVDIFEKISIRRAPLRQLQRSYNPDYYCFYKSHSQHQEGDAEPIEDNPDQRGNLLKGALFRIVLPIGAVVFIFAFYVVYSFFNPKPLEKGVPTAAKSSNAVQAQQARPADNESPRWRVVGWINTGSMRVVLSDGAHRRIIAPPNWKMGGMDVETFLPSGEAVTPWTGGARGGGLFDHKEPDK